MKCLDTVWTFRKTAGVSEGINRNAIQAIVFYTFENPDMKTFGMRFSGLSS